MAVANCMFPLGIGGGGNWGAAFIGGLGRLFCWATGAPGMNEFPNPAKLSKNYQPSTLGNITNSNLATETCNFSL